MAPTFTAYSKPPSTVSGQVTFPRCSFRFFFMASFIKSHQTKQTKHDEN
jgi:hypothetical protein